MKFYRTVHAINVLCVSSFLQSSILLKISSSSNVYYLYCLLFTLSLDIAIEKTCLCARVYARVRKML